MLLVAAEIVSLCGSGFQQLRAWDGKRNRRYQAETSSELSKAELMGLQRGRKKHSGWLRNTENNLSLSFRDDDMVEEFVNFLKVELLAGCRQTREARWTEVARQAELIRKNVLLTTRDADAATVIRFIAMKHWMVLILTWNIWNTEADLE